MNAVLAETEDKVTIPPEARGPRGFGPVTPVSVSATQVLATISAGYLPPCTAFSPQSAQPVWDIDGVAALIGFPSGRALIAELRGQSPRFHGIRSAGTIGDMPATVGR
jgi:hypothetical protein